jgi:hypothetical protein
MIHLFTKHVLKTTESPDNEQNKPCSHTISNFRLPIEYLEEEYIHTLPSNVISDLELCDSENTPMYEFLIDPKHEFSKNMMKKCVSKYTTNIPFLIDTQNIIKSSSTYLEKTRTYSNYNVNCEKINEIWKSLKEDASFLEKHYFMEWPMLKHMNESSTFLQCISMVNIMSPLISLFIPVIFLIMPFIILKIQRIPIDFNMYLEILKSIAKNHFIGKTLLGMQKLTPENMLYLLISFAFYMFQIYQNVTSCLRFYTNIKKMNEYLLEIKDYVQHSIVSMENFVEINKNKKTYEMFSNETYKHCLTLKELLIEIENLKPFSLNINKITELGCMLKCYYHLYDNIEYEDALKYSFEFEGYINNIIGIYENIVSKKVHFATFDENVDCNIEQQYYPPYKNGEPVKNTCKFDKNMIISAPNASGKTTFIKTTCINIIFTQQFGCGFYKSCVLNPYTHIHSYLNIPDTSGRDSLFQAESRRCKEIIDVIDENKDSKIRHFCIFDELYSGTNPTEATKSAYAFLKYLTKFDNVDFILTTHYVSVCDKFKKSKHIRNYKMDVENLDNGKLKYTYKLKPGISKIEGAVEILKDMNYPSEIIENIEQY